MNAVSDFLSLIQTRWFLAKMGESKSSLPTVLLLLSDFVITTFNTYIALTILFQENKVTSSLFLLIYMMPLVFSFVYKLNFSMETFVGSAVLFGVSGGIGYCIFSIFEYGLLHGILQTIIISIITGLAAGIFMSLLFSRNWSEYIFLKRFLTAFDHAIYSNYKKHFSIISEAMSATIIGLLIGTSAGVVFGIVSQLNLSSLGIISSGISCSLVDPEKVVIGLTNHV